MKQLLTTLIAILVAIGASAQAPEQMSYQAVIRDATNALVISQVIGTRISILQGSSGGPSVYTETHSPTSNVNGLVTLEVGMGTPVIGIFSAIDWSNGPYFIMTESDPSGGTTYTISATSQLLSVPYALHAKTADSVIGGVSESDPVYGSSIASGITSVDTAYWNSLTVGSQLDSTDIANLGFVAGAILTEVDGSITNEIQVLTISNDTIFLSNGGYVQLPLLNMLSDLDDDTKIQVEENPDDDVIRFDMGGVEYFTLDSGRVQVFNTGNSVFMGAGSGDNDDYTDNLNTAFGDSTLVENTIGNLNTAIGFGALLANTTGTHNTAGGVYALSANTTGVTNTAFGQLALGSNTTGVGNHAFGYGTLSANTSGFRNIAIGSSTLWANTIGTGNIGIGYSVMNHGLDANYNTAVGFEAMHFNDHGSSNTGIGMKALNLNEDGSFNTAVGESASLSNVLGNYNTALGTLALFNNANGSNNTAVGYYSNFTSTGSAFTNSAAVGYLSAITADNQVRLGNSSITSIGGFAAWSNLSDGRFKNNVQENVVGLDFIMQLRPVTYELDVDKLNYFLNVPDSLVDRDATEAKSAEIQTGFIAQEVEETAKALGFDFSGVDSPENANDHYSLRYAEFVVPLVKAVQDQQALIEEQKATAIRQQEMIEMLIKQMEALKTKVEKLED